MQMDAEGTKPELVERLRARCHAEQLCGLGGGGTAGSLEAPMLGARPLAPPPGSVLSPQVCSCVAEGVPCHPLACACSSGKSSRQLVDAAPTAVAGSAACGGADDCGGDEHSGEDSAHDGSLTPAAAVAVLTPATGPQCVSPCGCAVYDAADVGAHRKRLLALHNAPVAPKTPKTPKRGAGNSSNSSSSRAAGAGSPLPSPLPSPLLLPQLAPPEEHMGVVGLALAHHADADADAGAVAIAGGASGSAGSHGLASLRRFAVLTDLLSGDGGVPSALVEAPPASLRRSPLLDISPLPVAPNNNDARDDGGVEARCGVPGQLAGDNCAQAAARAPAVAAKRKKHKGGASASGAGSKPRAGVAVTA